MIFFILYILLGCIIAGVSMAYCAKHDNVNDLEPLFYLGIPLLWPLLVPILFVEGIKLFTHYVLYSKAERVEKVANKLKGY